MPETPPTLTLPAPSPHRRRVLSRGILGELVHLAQRAEAVHAVGDAGLVALVLAVPRAHVRVYLSQREWRRSLSGAALSEGGTAVERPSAAAVRARMREAFTRLDTSGDGRLDATEFKVALRSLMQLDLPIEDCASIIHGVDQNGDGTLDFDEFCQAVDMKLEQQAGALEFTKLSVLFYAKLKHHTASHHEQISGHKATMATKKSD